MNIDKEVEVEDFLEEEEDHKVKVEGLMLIRRRQIRIKANQKGRKIIHTEAKKVI